MLDLIGKRPAESASCATRGSSSAPAPRRFTSGMASTIATPLAWLESRHDSATPHSVEESRLLSSARFDAKAIDGKCYNLSATSD